MAVHADGLELVRRNVCLPALRIGLSRKRGPQIGRKVRCGMSALVATLALDAGSLENITGGHQATTS